MVVLEGFISLIAAAEALAVDGLIDGDLHGSSGTGQPNPVAVEAIDEHYGPLSVARLTATVAFLRKS